MCQASLEYVSQYNTDDRIICLYCCLISDTLSPPLPAITSVVMKDSLKKIPNIVQDLRGNQVFFNFKKVFIPIKTDSTLACIIDYTYNNINIKSHSY